MTSFWVIMVKRRDGLTYADLHKTSERIHLTLEDARNALKDYPPSEREGLQIVELVAMTPQELELAIQK